MRKELPKKDALKNFLIKHCEIKSSASSNHAPHKCYIFNAKDCVLFMAEAYIHGMRNSIGQDDAYMAEARKSGDYSKVIMIYNWSAPAPGIDIVQIPEALVESLSKEQASVFLRNLQLIQKDIDEGSARKAELQKLFSNKAVIETCYALDGERQFFIKGVVSSEDRKGYAERYAEHVATNVLFDLPKALNARLHTLFPDEYEDRHFIEGRSGFSKKVRYGAEAHTELFLSDEGAGIIANIASKSAHNKQEVSKLLKLSITDPFGLSLKYYLGKHQIIKLSKTD